MGWDGGSGVFDKNYMAVNFETMAFNLSTPDSCFIHLATVCVKFSFKRIAPLSRGIVTHMISYYSVNIGRCLLTKQAVELG